MFRANFVLFWALWHSREKRLLALSCPLPSCISAALTGQICVKFSIETSMKIFRESTNLVKIIPKYRQLSLKTKIRFIVASDINSPVKALLCNAQYFCIVGIVMWLNEIENALLILRCNSAYPIAPHLYVKRRTPYVIS
jgi:hypothetical protein